MAKRPLLIFILFLLITTILLGVNFLGMEILSAVRAYVGGEGLYSKGQKNAVYYLNRYVITGKESEYREYRNSIAIPLGDQIARKELLKKNTDFKEVYRGFIQAKNHEKDVKQMALLFKYGKHTPFMSKAIEIWTEGDSNINAIDAIARQLHHLVKNKKENEPEINRLLSELIVYNDRLTVLEDNFSITLGIAARNIKNVIIVITWVTAILLFIFCVYVAMMIVKKIRETGEKYERLFSESHDCVFITGIDGKIIEINKAGLELMEEVSNEDVKNKNILDFYHDVEERKELIAELQKHGYVQNREIVLKNKLGRKINGLMSANAVYNRKGEIVFIRGILKDITILKRVEEELIQKNRELEKTNMELDRFVYTTSHDLRAPLSSILGLIDIIRDEKDEDEIKLELDMMEKSVKKLDNFISDVISYARNSQTELYLEEINFLSLVSDCLDTYRYIKNVEKIETIINVRQNRKFFSDKKRLGTVINNLISNAIKYHNYRQENPYIKIDVEVNEKNAIISIKDNGKGIAKEHHVKIFDMFYMVASSRSGTGLGLYIVKETIEKLKGNILLKSEQGIGTEFIITLPDLLEKD